MSTLVLEAIDASITELAREVPAPSGDLFFGRDLSCTTGLADNLDEVDERSPLGVAQAAVRRLITARGSLPDDPDYGIDVRAFCNRGTTTAELRELGGRIRVELAKDDRIADLTVAVTAPSSNTLTVFTQIRPADPAIEAFALTLAVTSSSVVMEAIA